MKAAPTADLMVYETAAPMVGLLAGLLVDQMVIKKACWMAAQ